MTNRRASAAANPGSTIRHPLNRPLKRGNFTLSPRARRTLHQAVLQEILEERVVSSRGRQVPRGVKRKMSSYSLRPRTPPLTTRIDFTAAIQIAK